MGANRPERLRLPVMIWVTPRATSASAPMPATKSGTAIGNGCTLPCVTSSLSAANASRGTRPASAAAPAEPPRAMRRRRLKLRGLESGKRCILFLGEDLKIGSAAVHVARIEGDFDVLPRVVFG